MRPIRVIIIFFLFFDVFIVSSCNNDSFYTSTKREDLARFPLIYPYEAINVLWNADPKYRLDFKDWAINFQYVDSSHPYWTQVMSSSFNVENGTIYGTCVGSIYESKAWFLIIPELKVEKVFLGNDKEWKNLLQQRGIIPNKMFNPWNIYDDFKADQQLPWHKSD